MSTCNRLDLQTLGFQLVMMPKKLPITALDESTLNFFIQTFTRPPRLQHMNQILIKHGRFCK